MFKAGDKVRCTDSTNTVPLVKDRIYTVASCDLRGVKLVETSDWGGWHHARFEPVVEEPTPQELANKYRRLRREALDISKTLSLLGYALFFNGKQTQVIEIGNYVFKKTVTEEIVL